LNGRILTRLREMLPNYLYANTWNWTNGDGWEAWEAKIHISNMYGEMATLLVGSDANVEGSLFVTLPDSICPPNERNGGLPSTTRLPLNQSNLDLCIHNYITIRGQKSSDLPRVKWQPLLGKSAR